MSNKIFSAMLYDMMGWSMDCRYKILGYKITHSMCLLRRDVVVFQLIQDSKNNMGSGEKLPLYFYKSNRNKMEIEIKNG